MVKRHSFSPNLDFRLPGLYVDDLLDLVLQEVDSFALGFLSGAGLGANAV